MASVGTGISAVYQRALQARQCLRLMTTFLLSVRVLVQRMVPSISLLQRWQRIAIGAVVYRNSCSLAQLNGLFACRKEACHKGLSRH